MKKRLMITVLAAAALVAAFATTAQAFPSKTSACSNCHTKSATVNVAAVETANDGVKATYSVTVTGPNAILGWTVLDGSTNVANATAGTGTFQVAVGSTYTVWGVSKSGSAMPSSNSITISPVAPPVVGTPTPTTPPATTPTETPVVTPVVTPVGKSTVTLRRYFKYPKRTVVKLKNTTTGKVVLGKISKSKKKVTFKSVPHGTYVLTVKVKKAKAKKIGTYTVAANSIKRYVATR